VAVSVGDGSVEAGADGLGAGEGASLADGSGVGASDGVASAVASVSVVLLVEEYAAAPDNTEASNVSGRTIAHHFLIRCQ
jgi:hypothetical protein